MNLDQYQEAAHEFAAYEEDEYPFFGLAEEVGELLGLIAKSYRGDDLVARYGSRDAVREQVMKEAGDVLWQLSECMHSLGISLADVAIMNIQKLQERASRGVIKGSGNDR